MDRLETTMAHIESTLGTLLHTGCVCWSMDLAGVVSSVVHSVHVAQIRISGEDWRRPSTVETLTTRTRAQHYTATLPIVPIGCHWKRNGLFIYNHWILNVETFLLFRTLFESNNLKIKRSTVWLKSFPRTLLACAVNLLFSMFSFSNNLCLTRFCCRFWP